ncbi:DUF937 domain-containing protein [Nonomuraea sp. NPDC050310]|uniref:DUF937 domain-containing protein n=1 Tax=Nonomuraea sp. NPDC050310 TaxID=3154935 RepID=UPI0033D968BC
MSLNDELLEQLGSSGLQQIAGLLGTDVATARQAVEAATGTIVGGLAQNAERPEGADALRTALDEHVSADPFNSDLSSVTRDGHGILGHVLGEQGTEHAAAGISQFAGINMNTVLKLLPLLAPMIMSLLAGRANQRGMDAGAVAQDLNNEKSEMSGGGLGDLLNAVLGGAGGGGLGGLLGGLLGDSGAPQQSSQQPPQQPSEPRQPQSAQGGGSGGGTNPDW